MKQNVTQFRYVCTEWHLKQICLYRMAPEVIACETSTEEPYTCSADIWSFGQFLWHFYQHTLKVDKWHGINIHELARPNTDRLTSWLLIVSFTLSFEQNYSLLCLCSQSHTPPLGHVCDVMLVQSKGNINKININKNVLCYRVVYYYNGAQRYAQF